MKKTLSTAAVFVLALSFFPFSSQAATAADAICHPVGMKRMLFCIPHEWGALEELKRVKTSNIDSDGTRIIQAVHLSPTADGMKEDDTTLVKVNVWKSNKKLSQWVESEFGSDYADTLKKARRSGVFSKRTSLAKTRTYTENGQTVTERVVYAKRKKRMYKVTLKHWGEKGDGWYGGKRILRSFRLR